jgi:stress-induced-phosphoprotein 1
MSEEAVAKRAAKARAAAKKEEGNARYKARDFAAALACYEAAAELDPDDITYLLNKAAVFFEEGRLDECVDVCKAAIARGREVFAPYATIAKAYVRIGNTHVKRGDLASAIEAYENAQLEHHSEEILDKLKKLRRELKAAEESAYKDPAKGAEAKERGNEAFKRGDFPTAVVEYSEAIKRDPGNAVYYANRAAARTKLMDFPAALADCDKALKLDPKYAKAYSRRGALQVLMKEYHKVRACLAGCRAWCCALVESLGVASVDAVPAVLRAGATVHTFAKSTDRAFGRRRALQEGRGSGTARRSVCRAPSIGSSQPF